MESVSLTEMAKVLEAHDLPDWHSLPELDLYMDQVITMLARRFDGLAVDNDRPLTPSMINNYVKDGVIPRPERKKYNNEHLTALSAICMLKAEFSLPEIRALLHAMNELYTTEELYDTFRTAQNAAVKEAAVDLLHADTLDRGERLQTAMSLALEANAKRIAASKLLATLVPASDEEADKKEKSEKKKKKKD